MKKAFTLIELLVVIAIIAILAAILFPVFAQAKVAAKKTAAISNQKQIGLSVLMYAADYDDVYPRNDDCYLRSALNPALNAAGYTPSNGDGCSGAGPYPWRMNHYSWQKWVLPYVKSVQMFEHPARSKMDVPAATGGWRQWTDNGQIMGGFAINLALTGALNTYMRSATAAGRLRNSWLGGTQSAIPNVSGAMLLFEFSNPNINYSPVIVDPTNDPLSTQTVYPMAIREFWAANFKKTDASCNPLAEDDGSRVSGGAIVVGFADGSAKALQINNFLSKTPTAAEYGVPVDANTKCGISSGTYRPGATPVLNLNYPFWAFGS
ncbi:MAG: prepilin-type N-terminal cleavage/methylation domain-containing protein [Fimbriimonadaceae bacterium]|nr:prepilin-type N-terminal cleavage/methylation domain-containing protein [Fimbriimonadaceae bacterium]